MDPLAQLKDIHLPESVHSYPIAPGWWLAAVTLLALFIYTGIKLRRYALKHKAKKIALKKVANTNDPVTVVNTLKWALLQYFPRTQVAHLYGDNLKSFLTTTIPTQHQQRFEQLSANGFNSVYQRTEHHGSNEKDFVNFTQAATLWLSQALPPKTCATQSNSASRSVLTGHKEIVSLTPESTGDKS